MGSGGSTQFYQLTPAEEQDFAALSQEEQQKISTALSRLEEDRAQASGWDNIINAAGAGLVQTVRRFLQEDPAAVQSTDENGRTALQLAALNRHAQVVKELLAARAAVQAADHDGDTSLHHAAFGSSAEVVQDLLAARADVDAKNNNGRTALDFAQMKGCQDVVALLSFDLEKSMEKCLQDLQRAQARGDLLHMDPEKATAWRTKIDQCFQLQEGSTECRGDPGIEDLHGKTQEKVKDVKQRKAQPGRAGRFFLELDTLFIVLKDRPAVLAETGEISYHGNIREGAQDCVVSFPGKFASGWDALTDEFHDSSVACVFLCTAEDGLGQHPPDPDAPPGTCYCSRIYGERDYKTFGYLIKVCEPYTDEKMMKAKKKAEVMNAVVLRADASPEERSRCEQEAQKKYEQNQRRAAWGCGWFPIWMGRLDLAVQWKQRLKVVFFPGQVGKGKFTMDQLQTADLWDGIGCGGSQKAEIAYLDQKRQEAGPAWAYDELDVAHFLQAEFQRDTPVDAWDACLSAWRRGRIVEVFPDQHLGAKWEVQCDETHERFESTHIRHTSDAIHKLLTAIDESFTSEMFHKALPEEVDLLPQSMEPFRLPSGQAAWPVKVRIRSIAAMHELRDKVLSGDFDKAMNACLSKIHNGMFQVQIEKAEFFERYERSLLVMSELTVHQEEKLQMLQECSDQHAHLSAPAGSGKTFVAVQCVLDTLSAKWPGKIAYIAPNPALGLHFIQWLVTRHVVQRRQHNYDPIIDDILDRVVLMFPPPYKSPISLKVRDGQLVHTQVEDAAFVLAVYDEAHVLFRSAEMLVLFDNVNADRKLLLSDLSQSATMTTVFPKVAIQISLEEIVRSTKRIVSAALAFRVGVDAGQRCCGTIGPPLKTYLFEASSTKPIKAFCHNVAQSLRHILQSFPCLRSLDRRVAILVPDIGFLKDLKKELKKLDSMFTSRQFRLQSFEDSLEEALPYMWGYQRYSETYETLLLDTVENARGQEVLIAICVGLDETLPITPTEDLAARARIYQGITRAQFMAIIVDRYLQGGWLEYLSTLEYDNEQQFREDAALAEVSPAAASKIVKMHEKALPSQAMKEDAGDEDWAEVKVRDDQDADGSGSADRAVEAEGARSEGAADERSTTNPAEKEDMPLALPQKTTVWDTRSNKITSPIRRPRFDPRAAAQQAAQSVIHATFDVEHGRRHDWKFSGPDDQVAEMPVKGPKLLVSKETATTGVLSWLLQSLPGNDSFIVGVIPADQAEVDDYLFSRCDWGVKSRATWTVSGGVTKEAELFEKYIEIVADLDGQTLKVKAGNDQTSLVEVESRTIPFQGSVKLAVTGWGSLGGVGTKVRLVPPTA